MIRVSMKMKFLFSAKKFFTGSRNFSHNSHAVVIFRLWNFSLIFFLCLFVENFNISYRIVAFYY